VSVPSMPLFCGDYLKDTTDLTLEEHGAYLMILMITWATGGKPLPDDDARMAKRLSVTKDRWVNKLKPVLSQFFDLSRGTWRNERLEREWNYVQAVIAKRREAGAKGGSAPKNGPNGPNFQAASRENFSQNGDANPRKDNETTKANGADLLKQNGSTHTHTSSAYAEESKVESVCDVGVSPRETHTPPPPDSLPAKTNVVKFVSPADRQPMPATWVLPEKWRAAAADAGLSTPELSALKFRDHWRDKGAVKDEAGWYSAWEWWFRKDIEWERKHGQQHHNTGRRTKSGGGLAAYAHAEMQHDPGFAEDHQDDGRWREL
jgi:uncharacterized protein YdaU (DUF1376 family)